MDDNEDARYLAQYLFDHQNQYLVRSFDGLSVYVNKDKLEDVLKEYWETMP